MTTYPLILPNSPWGVREVAAAPLPVEAAIKPSLKRKPTNRGLDQVIASSDPEGLIMLQGIEEMRLLLDSWGICNTGHYPSTETVHNVPGGVDIQQDFSHSVEQTRDEESFDDVNGLMLDSLLRRDEAAPS